MPKSVQGILQLLFLSLVLLILISAGGIYWAVEAQRQSALLADLAARQVVLAERMAELVYTVGSGETVPNAALQDVEQQFDEMQSALRSGGTVPYRSGTTLTVPATRNPDIPAALAQVDATWSQTRSLLGTLRSTPRGQESFAITLRVVEQLTTQLSKDSEAVLRLYEADAAAHFNRLRILQVTLPAVALVVLLAGILAVRRSVVRPLQQLQKGAARLASNDLDATMAVDSPAELAALSRSMEAVRANLRSSQQELGQLNTDLDEHIARRTRELELLNDISREISSRLDIQQVLNSVTEKARSLMGGDAAALCLMDENRHWLKLQAISGPANAVNGMDAPAYANLARSVLKSDQALVCGVGNCHGECQILSPAYRKSHLAAPLRTGDQVTGALCVGSLTDSRFAGDSVVLLTKLANTAAIALENAHLYAQAERVATLEERHRLAAEMHDGLGQMLSYLGLMTDQTAELLSRGQDTEALGRLAKTRGAVGEATAELRRAINSLMEDAPVESDLRKRLQVAAEEASAGHGLRLNWGSDLDAPPQCSRETAEQVQNITLEALANVVRHAQARCVQVVLGRSNGCYSVTVEDDGRGFDPLQPGPKGHFGLQIMQTRAAHIGGRLQVESSPQHGTRVVLTWPMERKA